MMQDYYNLLSLLFVLGVITYAIYSLLFTNSILARDSTEETYLVPINDTSPENIKEVEEMYHAKLANLEQATSAWAQGSRWPHGAYVSEGRCISSNDTINTHDRCEYVLLFGKKPRNVETWWNEDQWSRYD